MHRQPDAFQETLAQFQTQTGLRLELSGSAHSVRLMVDDICVSLADKDCTQMLLEAEILRLDEAREDLNQQLSMALKANLGLLFDCSAAIQLSRSEDGDWLVARAILPYTVTTLSKLMTAIEDIAGLVDFMRRSEGQVHQQPALKLYRHQNLIFPV